jgi:exodeoxyribonuclease VII large subunit
MPERLPTRPRGAGTTAAPATGAGSFDLFSRVQSAQPLSVSELTRQIKGLLEGRFPSVAVQGEVSNVRTPSSGHVYFTLKDDQACLDCVLFRMKAQRVGFALRDGLSVVARGRLSLYEPTGRYQLLCDTVEPLGAGALQVALLQLKERLQREGLFDPARKRPVPSWPSRIALVTSPTGAAVHDFVRMLHRRHPGVPVLVVPTKVQGEGAAGEIARAIARAAAQPRVEVVVVTRGGGSLEDLWAFNEEVVARALAACPVPTVSAVGHEIDVTIADLVADLRAATPTAAAELLSPVRDELVQQLAERRGRLLRAWRARMDQRRAFLLARQGRLADPRRLLGERRLSLDRLEQRLLSALRGQTAARRSAGQILATRLERAHPAAGLQRLQRTVSLLDQRLGAAERALLAEARRRLGERAARLDALSPMRVLGRGYAVAFDATGRALTDAASVEPGDEVRVRLARGELEADVTAVRQQG